MHREGSQPHNSENSVTWYWFQLRHCSLSMSGPARALLFRLPNMCAYLYANTHAHACKCQCPDPQRIALPLAFSFAP